MYVFVYVCTECIAHRLGKTVSISYDGNFNMCIYIYFFLKKHATIRFSIVVAPSQKLKILFYFYLNITSILFI